MCIAGNDVITSEINVAESPDNDTTITAAMTALHGSTTAISRMTLTPDQIKLLDHR